MTSSKIWFGAVVGHADTPELLGQNIRHHLRIGVQRILVSLNKEAESLSEAFAADERVRILPAAEFSAPDSFQFLTSAAAQLQEWAEPEWIMFADSDEFWLPRGGALADVSHLQDKDLFIAERFNTPVLRGADGAFQAPNLDDPYLLPLIGRRESIQDAYLVGDTQVPWILGQDAPKLMVRAALVDKVGAGGHSILARDPALRWHWPDDLLVLHAPFTTQDRFLAKVAAVKRIFAQYGDRFNANQAWHWRYWLTLDEAELRAEFRRQSFRAASVQALQTQGVLTTPEAQYAKLPGFALWGDALYEALGRAISNYERPGTAVLRAGPAAAQAAGYAPERAVNSAEECCFYHCMDIPGHGEVLGQWDLRGRESVYLGETPIRGKRVLEIGPASGALSFWMERQGAEVTSFDLDEHQSWDLVEMTGIDHGVLLETRKAIMRQINNSWWFARTRLGAKARAVYGTIYALDKIPLTYDVVTVNSVLLHLRDPFRALAQAAARTHDTLVVTDVAERHFLPPDSPLAGAMSMHFIPRLHNRGPLDTWWYVPEQLAEEFLRILGFREITLSRHTQRFMPDQDWHLYTLVARR